MEDGADEAGDGGVDDVDNSMEVVFNQKDIKINNVLWEIK